MNDNAKHFPGEDEANTVAATEENQKPDADMQRENPSPTSQPQQEADPDAIVASIARGKLALSKPILSKGKEITELHYDFMAMSGMEYADAIDSEASRGADSFHLTNKQALALFAVAATKKTEDVDKEAIVRGISVGDSIKAIQAATLFFVTSSRVGNKRISRE